MDIITEIMGQNSGAKFVRADLHIHSFGCSYDVKDDTLTPEQIIDLAIRENVRIISITDHNSIVNVKKAYDYAADKKILLIPGVELSTTEGHLLVYFETPELLESFIGKLTITPDKKSCHHTFAQVLKIAKEFNGIGIAAHVDLNNGFETYLSGYTPFKEEIFKIENLVAFEITNVLNVNWFTVQDTSADRKRLGGIYRAHFNTDPGYEIPKVMSSDAHTLSNLGKNSSGNKKITRIKISELSFNAFKIAFKDPESRIRIEDLIPEAVPHFVGVKFDGGLLDKQCVQFSKNLTCIIGGRGAGKSTLLEAVRIASGNESTGKSLDSEVWPERISLVFRDEVGKETIFTRNKLSDAVNVLDPIDGISYVKIDSYGQGETAETIQHCGKDPNILLQFLDSFTDVDSLKKEDEKICEELLENQTKIERLRLAVKTIPDIEKARNNANAQITILKAEKAKEVVELAESLAKEKSFREQLEENYGALVENITDALSDKELFESVTENDGIKINIGSIEFEEIKVLIEHYSTSVDEVSVLLEDKSKEVTVKIEERLKEWKVKEVQAENNIEKIRKGLQDKGIILNMAFIRKVTKDAADFTSKLRLLKAQDKELKQLIKDRNELNQKRKDIKLKIYYCRHGFATKLNESLKSTVIDYQISLKYNQGTNSQDLQTILKEALGYRTSKVTKVELLVQQISFQDLLKSITTQDVRLIATVQDDDGAKVFSTSEAISVLEKISVQEIVFKIEQCLYEDLPELLITKEIKSGDGPSRYIQRNFSKLSMGQQQSILLSILLYSKQNYPLLIDQPEDNLDSEFVYKTLVKNLRRVKEFRQVIIVTHNANIAVLGDAELIVPLKTTNELAMIVDRGSIDSNKTKVLTCTILEGSQDAFKKRKEIYGI